MSSIINKWKKGLAKTSKAAFGQIATFLGATEISIDTWDELEALLVQADMGMDTTRTSLPHCKSESTGRIHQNQRSESSAAPGAAQASGCSTPDRIFLPTYSDPHRRCERLRQDHQHRQAWAALHTTGETCNPGRGGYLPGRGRGSARDVGRATEPAGCISGQSVAMPGRSLTIPSGQAVPGKLTSC